MTGSSGALRDGEASRPDAAGASAISDVNAVKKRRARRPWRTAFFALAATGVIAAAAWVLFASRLLAVRSVIVTGTHLVPRSAIIAAAGIQPGTPLIRVNTAQVAARVDTIMQVRSARVTRSWPDQMVIAVQERTPALALMAPDGGYALVDADGVIVRWSARRPADLPLFTTAVPGASLRGDPGLAAAAAVLGELPAQLRHLVVSVTAPASDQVTLRLAGGITVVWGGTDRAGAKERELAALMPDHMHYYDVSAPGTVTVK